MTYRVRTEQTAKFVPINIFAGRAEKDTPVPSENNIIDYMRAPSAPFTPAILGGGGMRIIDVDVYPLAFESLSGPVSGFAFATAADAVVYGVVTAPIQIEASVGAYVSTQPLTSMTVLSFPFNATNTVTATLAAVALEKARNQIAEARQEAAGRDLRSAYRNS